MNSGEVEEKHKASSAARKEEPFIQNTLFYALAIFYFLFGASLGSYWHHAWNTPQHTEKRSHCDHCHHILSATDLIPIFGYLLRKGKCHYCQHPINKGSFYFEISSGLLLLILFFILLQYVPS